MSKRHKKVKERQFGKQSRQPDKVVKNEKKHLIPPKHKNTIWTIVFIIVLMIFFIINNTRETPAEGPYPPNYNPGKVESNNNSGN